MMTSSALARLGWRPLLVAAGVILLVVTAWVPLAAGQDLDDDPQVLPTGTETPTDEPTETPTVDPTETVTLPPEPTEPASPPVEDMATDATDEVTTTIEQTLGDDQQDDPPPPQDDPSPTDEPTPTDDPTATEPTEATDEPTGTQPTDPDPAPDGHAPAPAKPTIEHDGDIGTVAGLDAADDTGPEPVPDPAAPQHPGGPPNTVLPLLPALPVLPDATGPRSTADIIDALEAAGARPAQIARVLAPFPVAGRAYYGDDWHAVRTSPSFHLHEGVDIFAARGTPVIAIADGQVTAIGLGTAVGGNTVRLTADDGTEYFYAHLDAVADRLHPGQRVTAATVLGTVGTTGNAAATPPHLHLQVHPHGGAPVPPVPYLDRWLAQARTQLGLDALSTTTVAVGMMPRLQPPGTLAPPLVAPPLATWAAGASGLEAALGASAGTHVRSGITAATTPLAGAPASPPDTGSTVPVALAVLAVLLWYGRGRHPKPPTSGFVPDGTFRDQSDRPWLADSNAGLP